MLAKLMLRWTGRFGLLRSVLLQQNTFGSITTVDRLVLGGVDILPQKVFQELRILLDLHRKLELHGELRHIMAVL